MPKVTFNNTNNVFAQSLKSAVEQYFHGRQLKKTGNWKLYIKAMVLIAAAILLYVFLLFFQYPAIVGIAFSMLLGFTLSCIGFNVMHDACHGSYSSKKWVNEFWGLSLNALGGNAYIWKLKHNIIHHTYTNIDGMDDDIAKSPLLRQAPTQKWLPMHRYQHIYIALVYTITSLAWSYIIDFVKYFKQKVYTTAFKPMSTKEHIIFWASKILALTFYVAIPILLLGWQAWLIGFICMHVTMGFTLAIVFQLAHVVENVEFEKTSDSPKLIEAEWAAYQVKTTADFAAKNRVVSWFVGGLNFQIEHHLFPRVSHIHYPALSHIVKEQCEKFNLPYNYYPTTRKAIISHFKMMKHLGIKPETK